MVLEKTSKLTKASASSSEGISLDHMKTGRVCVAT